MFGPVMVHELRLLWRDRMFLLLSVTFAVLSLYAAVSGGSWVVRQEADITAAQTEEQERYARLVEHVKRVEAGGEEAKTWKDPRMPGAVGAFIGGRAAVLPPSPLAGLAVGQSDLNPAVYQVTTMGIESVLTREEIANPVHLLIGGFDLAFILIFLYPLLVLAFTYDLLSGERERGTLVMILSQPIGLDAVLLRKVAVRGGGVLVLALLMSGIAYRVAGGSLEPAALMYLGAWMAAAALYGSVWFALALWVNSFGKSSAENAVALFGLWVVLALIVPATLALAVQTAHPAPSWVEFEVGMRDANVALTRDSSRALARYYEDHPELVAPGKGEADDSTVKFYAVREEVERQMRPMMERFEAQRQAQQEAMRRWGILSPPVLMQEVFSDLAGTGTERHREFVTAVREYHQAWRAYFIRKVLDKSKLSSADYATIPTFVWREAPPQEVLSRVALSLMGVFGPALGLFALAAWKLRRFRIA